MKPSSEKPRFNAGQAMAVALSLLDHIRPFTTRCEVAGSLRREKRTVGDIELLFVPMHEPRKLDMFSVAEVDLAEEQINSAECRTVNRG